jgi:hypothetical protein
MMIQGVMIMSITTAEGEKMETLKEGSAAGMAGPNKKACGVLEGDHNIIMNPLVMTATLQIHKIGKR